MAKAGQQAAGLPPSQAARALMVLGLLQGRPRHGYEIHQIVMAHGSLYADFNKKATLYHLLARLAALGAVEVSHEAGARGPRGERLVYALNAAGRALFRQLLRRLLGSYEDSQAGFQVAAGFISWIPVEEAGALLRQRAASARLRRMEVVGEFQHLLESPAGPMEAQRAASRFLATDLALAVIDAELAWIDKTIRFLGESRPRQAMLSAIDDHRRAAAL